MLTEAVLINSGYHSPADSLGAMAIIGLAATLLTYTLTFTEAFAAFSKSLQKE